MNEKNKILFVIGDTSLYFLPYVGKGLFLSFDDCVRDKGKFRNLVDDYISNRMKSNPNSLLTKILCVIFISFLFKNKLLRNIKRADTIVFFDNIVSRNIIYYSLLYSKKIFVYTWNPINEKRIIFWKSLFPKNHIVTYSKIEAIQHELIYQRLPFLYVDYGQVPIKYDFYYLGRAKGERAQLLVHFFKRLKEFGYCVKLDLLFENEQNSFPSYPFLNVLSEYVSYDDFVKNTLSSRCVVECASSDNINETFRVPISIFYEKKLVTNNKNLLNEPFWNSNMLYLDFNTFDDTKLKRFLEAPIISSPNFVKDEYSIDAFIKSFCDTKA